MDLMMTSCHNKVVQCFVWILIHFLKRKRGQAQVIWGVLAALTDCWKILQGMLPLKLQQSIATHVKSTSALSSAVRTQNVGEV